MSLDLCRPDLGSSCLQRSSADRSADGTGRYIYQAA